MGPSSSQHKLGVPNHFTALYKLCKFSFLILIDIIAASGVSMKVKIKSRPMVFSVQRKETGFVIPTQLAELSRQQL
jgi:hypothetical protein